MADRSLSGATFLSRIGPWRPGSSYAVFADEPRPSTHAATALDNIMTVPLLALSTKVLVWEK